LKKINYNVPIYENFVAEFEKWSENTPGLKGDKCSGGMMAIMALHRIDEALAFALMTPDINVKKAANIIKKTVTDAVYRQALDALPPKKRAQILEDAKRSEEKAFGKK
jgi:hypothetical protein